MNSYYCEACDRTHKIFHGLEMPPPAIIAKMPKTEKAERIHDFGELVVVDKLQVFINGYLYVFLEGEEKPFFSWHLWVELDRLDLFGKLKKLNEGVPITVKGEFPGVAMLYDHADPISCAVTVFPYEKTPPEIVVTQTGQLQQDLAKPISVDRVKELMNRIHHAGDFLTKREKFEEPFAVRFNQLLDEVASAFFDKRQDYCINLQGKHVVSLQVVSSGVLEGASGQDKGFGIHLPFDPSDPEMALQERRFLSLPISENFTHHEWDGIPTYQLNLGDDRERLTTLVIIILSAVLKEKIDEVSFDHHAI